MVNEQSETVKEVQDSNIPVPETLGDHIGDGDSSDPIIIPLVDPYANWMIFGPESNHQFIAVKKLFKSGNNYYADLYCMLSDYRLDSGTVEIEYGNGVDLGSSYKFVDAIEMRGILKEFEQYNIIYDTTLNIFRHRSQTRAEMGGKYYYIEDNMIKTGTEDGGNIAYHHFVTHNYFMPCEYNHIGVMQTSFKNTPVTKLSGIPVAQ